MRRPFFLIVFVASLAFGWWLGTKLPVWMTVPLVVAALLLVRWRIRDRSSDDRSR